MSTEITELLAGCTAIGAGLGALLHHFFPHFLPKTNGKSRARTAPFLSSAAAIDPKTSLSFEEHTLLCAPIKQTLDEGKKHFEAITAAAEKINLEVRWLRALSIVQASPEAIKKANDIIGKPSE